MRNPHFQFKPGIAFSWTGYYAPTFRLNHGSVFDQSSSCIFQNVFETITLLGLLNSKIVKYITKNFCDHTVNSTASVIEKIVVPILNENVTNLINKLVNEIITKQQRDSKYDFASTEQIQIDSIVNKIYNLNEYDIKEVEDWYERRYPKLVNAQRIKSKKINEVLDS